MFDSSAKVFYRKNSLSEKRKAVESPDKNENSALTKSEMRTLRKKQKKLKKMEHKESEKKLLNSNGD